MQFPQFDLDPRILAGVHALGWEQPTPIQEQAIPRALEGRDVLGLARTGTGKTAAFLLPILQRLAGGPRGRVRALIVAPTRELAEQIHQTAVPLSCDPYPDAVDYKFEVERYLTEIGEWTEYNEYPAIGPSKVIYPYVPDAYRFRVWARTSTGWSDPSDWSVFAFGGEGLP